MAGVRGNIGWLLAAKQSAKGTAATPTLASATKVPYAGGNIAPRREINTLSETDSSRDRGVAYASVGGVEGSPEFYVRDASIGAYLYYALGTAAKTGTTNITHTITAGSATLPYVTFWRNIGNVLYEQFEDCKVGSLQISAEAGQPLTATAGIMGRKSKSLAGVAPVETVAVPLESSTVYNFNNATVTLAGSATALVRSFELGIENNLQMQQTDDFVPYDIYEGTREISLGFDLIFEDLAEYNKFHYASATPTTGDAQSGVIYTTAAVFDFPLGANNAVKFTLPSIAYEEFPVEPQAGGDPVVVSVRAVGQRSGSALLTAEVKNQFADYTVGS